jgi:hypothetical protein
LIIDPLKGWKSSDIWEQPSQIKILFRKKLRADLKKRRCLLLFSAGSPVFQLNDLYSSPNIVRVIKSRRMRWAGHVTSMEQRRGVYRVLVGKETTWVTQA